MAPGAGAERGRGVLKTREVSALRSTNHPAPTVDPIRFATTRGHGHTCPTCGLYACRARPCQAGDVAFCAQHTPSTPVVPDTPVHWRAREPVAQSVVGAVALILAILACWIVLTWWAS